MNLLVAYDISTDDNEGKRRILRVAKYCEARGTRVQDSVFEMSLDPRELEEFKAGLRELISEGEDSVRIYHLSKHFNEKTEQLGTMREQEIQDVLWID